MRIATSPFDRTRSDWALRAWSCNKTELGQCTWAWRKQVAKMDMSWGVIQSLSFWTSWVGSTSNLLRKATKTSGNLMPFVPCLPYSDSLHPLGSLASDTWRFSILYTLQSLADSSFVYGSPWFSWWPVLWLVTFHIFDLWTSSTCSCTWKAFVALFKPGCDWGVLFIQHCHWSKKQLFRIISWYPSSKHTVLIWSLLI